MKKLAYLEGLRGIAALIVVFHHLVLLFYPALNYGNSFNTTINTIAVSPLNIFYNGDFAVCLFFVLSGYVLSYKYILTNDPHILAGYAIKRYFRLMPLIAISVIVIFLFNRLNCFHTQKLNDDLHLGDWLTTMFNGDPSLVAMLKNIFYGIFLFGDNSYNPVVWSMGIEFIGSMLLFGFLLFNHKLKPKWILFVIVLLLALYLKRYYYISFLLGYALCYFDQKELFRVRSIILKFILLLAGIMCASYPADWQHWNTSIYAFMTFEGLDLFSFYHVFGSGILLMLITQHQASKQFFSLKPVLFLGKISFPMYLFHLIVLILVTPHVFSWFILTFNYNVCVLICIAICLPLILLVSYFSEIIIDKPALKLANKIEAWFLGKLKNNL
ncbi:MAG: acyltransferase [Bacteroidota bacterium]|nr:acyltransferase [Bacteroidota bacterium]